MRQFFLLSFVGLFVFVPALHAERDQSTSLDFSRLRLEAPGKWQVARSEQMLRAQPPFSDQGGIILQPATAFGFGAAHEVALAVANRFEKGRRILKSFPKTPRTGLSKSGAAFAFLSRLSQGKNEQDRWYTAYYTFSTGAQFQTLIVLGRNAKVFDQLVRELATPLDQIEVSWPETNPGKGVRLARDFSFFHYKTQLPGHWQADEGPVANLAQFKLGIERKAFLAEPFQAAMDLQLMQPPSPIVALVHFLENRVLWNFRGSYSSQTKLQLLNASDGRLPNGLRYVSVLIEKPIKYKDNDAYRTAGLLVYAPGNAGSILLGTALPIDNYSRRFKNAEMNADIRAWGQAIQELYAVAAQLSFDETAVARDLDAENLLKKQARFRYAREISASSGDVSFFSSTKVHWDFAGDGGVQYSIDRHRSFNAYDFDSLGRPDHSAGYFTGVAGSDQNGAQFSVWQNPARQARYIIVRYPSGLSTFHPVSFAEGGLRIDGFVHGCCR